MWKETGKEFRVWSFDRCAYVYFDVLACWNWDHHLHVICSTGWTRFHVFCQHSLANSGLCSIQQLVANVISSHVRAGSDALFILWWWFHSVFNQQGWWGLDRSCKVLDWCFCCWEHCHSCNSEACTSD
ncbi:hypothetical protein MRB53_018251 [Persea americana]|uniref:Uncharacterized protein n=1 Tax=Persea americana TaxID=3435 RepID=A0ACC2M7D5_PERAE|nr:hypothetical protein MRB53_018251 [Persea americana]